MNGSHWRDSVPIKPADALEKLASYVRERMDKRRRAGPKWTFRLAPDLIIQIQPLLPQEKHKRSGLVVKELLEFDGMAVEDEATSASDFDRLWGPDKKHFGFRINHEWVLRGRRIGGIPHERESWPVLSAANAGRGGARISAAPSSTGGRKVGAILCSSRSRRRSLQWRFLLPVPASVSAWQSLHLLRPSADRSGVSVSLHRAGMLWIRVPQYSVDYRSECA
jgi:hypothetical protein